MDALEGVAMELEDCGFATLQDIVVTDDPNVAFGGCNYALLVGAAPRGPGMERKDLLTKNGGKSSSARGKAIAKNAASDVRVLIVGNPCNTNCLVAYRNGRDVPADRWTAMTRLDHNRAVSGSGEEGRRAQNEVGHERDHLGQPLEHAVPGLHEREDRRQAGDERSSPTGRGWRGTFVPACQERGKAVINKRGLSSRVLRRERGAGPRQELGARHAEVGDWTSVATVSKGEYGVPPGLVFGYPCTTTGDGKWSVVEGVVAGCVREGQVRR